MNLKDLATLEQIEAFVSGTQAVAFEVGGNKDDRYRWIEATLRHHRYRRLGKRDSGLIRRFLVHVTGYSRATITRKRRINPRTLGSQPLCERSNHQTTNDR